MKEFQIKILLFSIYFYQSQMLDIAGVSNAEKRQGG
jgi:hypothetical protein